MTVSSLKKPLSTQQGEGISELTLCSRRKKGLPGLSNIILCHGMLKSRLLSFTRCWNMTPKNLWNSVLGESGLKSRTLERWVSGSKCQCRKKNLHTLKRVKWVQDFQHVSLQLLRSRKLNGTRNIRERCSWNLLYLLGKNRPNLEKGGIR